MTLGAILLVLVFVGPKSAWGLVGLLPLATGLLGSCPTYRLFGVSTRPSCEGLGEGEKNAERRADSPLPTVTGHSSPRQSQRRKPRSGYKPKTGQELAVDGPGKMRPENEAREGQHGSEDRAFTRASA